MTSSYPGNRAAMPDEKSSRSFRHNEDGIQWLCGPRRPRPNGLTECVPKKALPATVKTWSETIAPVIPVTVEGEDEQKKVHSLLSLVPHTTRRSARRTLAWRAHSVPVGCAGRFHNRLQTRLAPKKRIERRPRLRTPGLTTPRARETYQRPRIAKLIPPCCTHPRWILRGKTRIDPIAMTRLNAAQARPY